MSDYADEMDERGQDHEERKPRRLRIEIDIPVDWGIVSRPSNSAAEHIVSEAIPAGLAVWAVWVDEEGPSGMGTTAWVGDAGEIT